jgi:type IV secretory pathway VirD2 relaxase
MGEREPRIYPTRPKVGKSMPTWCAGYRGLLRAARALAPPKARGRWASTIQQRCVVKVRYSLNQSKGQWAAHGRYIARSAAVGKQQPFGSAAEPDAKATLKGWQEAGDRRLFKLVVSPEFGERVDLEQMTRELMQKIQSDLGGGALQWVAAVHRNTDNQHVHIALRGVVDGHDLTIGRDYIRHGIRRHAQDLVTQQLGYRSLGDAREAARRREVAMQVIPPQLDTGIGR